MGADANGNGVDNAKPKDILDRDVGVFDELATAQNLHTVMISKICLHLLKYYRGYLYNPVNRLYY